MVFNVPSFTYGPVFRLSQLSPCTLIFPLCFRYRTVSGCSTYMSLQKIKLHIKHAVCNGRCALAHSPSQFLGIQVFWILRVLVNDPSQCATAIATTSTFFQ